jgi:hypothetical protein
MPEPERPFWRRGPAHAGRGRRKRAQVAQTLITGDYNLRLLDEFNATPGVAMVWSATELGAGYSADGAGRRGLFRRRAARAQGESSRARTQPLACCRAPTGFARLAAAGAVVTTLGVGGLSALNACAGCYAEDLVGRAGGRAGGRRAAAPAAGAVARPAR